MSASTNATLLSDLLDPQVVADFIEKKLVDNIRLSPLAKLDYTLVGRPGDELTLPQYNYVGDAEGVAEGNDIPIAKLTQTTNRVKVSKIGRAVEFTDEALVSAFNNDIAEEAAKQVVTAINSGVESRLITAMSNSAVKTATIGSSADPASGIASALAQFGEDVDGEKVIAVPNSLYVRLLDSKNWIPNTDTGAGIIIRGAVGQVHGCQVVPMNRLTAYGYTVFEGSTFVSGTTYYELVNNEYVATEDSEPATGKTYYTKDSTQSSTAYIIKPGALAIYMKRDTLVEFDRDIIAETNFIKASKLFAPYVYDTSKLIKITVQ